MPAFVALLRGINVGGRVMVPMADLRAFFEAQGFGDAKTLLQSGNVIFTASGRNATTIERQLEPALAGKTGREIGVFVRDAAAWQKLVAGNPFTREATNDPARLVALCLRAAPKAEALVALKAAIPGREIFQPGPGCLYIYYPDGQGESKFTNALIERKLGVAGTARNWNTVMKISALLQ